MTAIVIDPEFHAALPPLSCEELQQLEANLRRDGCLDALVVWPVNGQEILLDGHHRYAICTRLSLPFRTTRIAMASRQDALIWILQLQLGRRNLSDFARTEVALKHKALLAAQAHHRRVEGNRRGGLASPANSLSNLIATSTPGLTTQHAIAHLAGCVFRAKVATNSI